MEINYNEKELLADGLRQAYRKYQHLTSIVSADLSAIYTATMANMETLFAKLYEGEMSGRYTLAEFWAKVDELDTAK